VSTARTVRIPRPRARPTEEGPAPELPRDIRYNRGGLQRALRLSLLYVGGLVAVYAGFLAYAGTGPDGLTPGIESALVVFGVTAALLAAGGTLVALASAPRTVELSGRETRVVNVFGWVRRFPALGTTEVRALRRFPAGWLSSGPVLSVEFAAGRLRRTYLLEEGLVPTAPPAV
jgi:hypothetical protein